MKEKISITVEKETIEAIEREIAEGTFRNRSHAIEFAVKKMMRDGDAG